MDGVELVGEEGEVLLEGERCCSRAMVRPDFLSDLVTAVVVVVEKFSVPDEGSEIDTVEVEEMVVEGVPIVEVEEIEVEGVPRLEGGVVIDRLREGRREREGGRFSG